MKFKVLILKDYRPEDDENYSYWDNNEHNCLARYINKNKIDNYCGLRADDIVEYKTFKNGNTHVTILQEA